MVKSLVKYIATLFVTSAVATAVVLTALHQMFWRFTPVSFDQARAPVVQVTNLYGTCSGVVVAPTVVLTASHCFGENLKANDKEATVIKRDVMNDLMLLRVLDLDVPMAVLAKTAPETDETVYMVGIPLGMAKIVRPGSYVAMAKPQPGLEFDMIGDYLINGYVEGGASGGAVFVFRDGQFQLIGIINAGSRSLTLSSGLEQIKEILK